MKQLRIAPDLALPLDAITQTFGVLAVRGAGKSNLAAVMAEEMAAASLPFVVVDPVGAWWGLRSAGDGKGPGIPVPIFGGAHGDVPLERTAGQVIADLVVGERLSCVLDVSDFSEGDKIRFLIDFAERLYRQNRDPLHLFLEEADDYAPQRPFREQARLLRAWENIVRRGRARGLGITMISQRSASLNKSVLTQIETLCVLRTTSPQDRKAIGAWVEYHGQAKELLESLPGLQAGEAWVWSPSWLQTMKRVQVRRRRTFDSGATPRDVKGRRPPATLADVDLGAVKAQMAATIERAKAEDPRELRKQVAAARAEIAALQRSGKQLAERGRFLEEQGKALSSKRVEVPVLKDAQVKRLEAAAGRIDRAMVQLGKWAQLFTGTEREVRNVGAEISAALAAARGAATAPLLVARSRAGSNRLDPRMRKRVVEGGDRFVASVETSARPAPAPRVNAAAGGADLTGPQQEVLDAAAFLESIGIQQPDVVQLALFSGRMGRGGNWRALIGSLRTLGLIQGTSLTEAGRALARDAGIRSVEDLHAAVKALLSGPQAELLGELLKVYPGGLEPDELAQRVGKEASGGNWRANVGRLRSLGLVSKRGPLQALPVLFLEA